MARAVDCFEAQFAASLRGNVFSGHGKVYNSNLEINNMCCYSFIRSVDFLKTQLVASRATIFFGEWIRLSS